MKNVDWEPVRVLSIAGSDSGGGAGLQADIKTVSALGGYSATAVSAVTVQNTTGVKQVMPVPAKILCAQVQAVLEDIKPQAVKISMLPEADMAPALAKILKKYGCRHIVLDPVMVATSGHSLVDMPAMEAVVKYLFPLAETVTPNMQEAQVLCGGRPIYTKQDFIETGRRLLSTGCRSVLMKGGHAEAVKGMRGMRDMLVVKGEEAFPLWYASPRVNTRNLHGTGCTLSAAVAFYLAAGEELERAVALAKDYIYRAVRGGARMKVGAGNGPLNHFFAPEPTKRIRL